jgi:V/A-type H+-transporting ATPase subunit A
MKKRESGSLIASMSEVSTKAEQVGVITAINGNLISADFTEKVRQNEVAHVLFGDRRLKSEVIRIQGSKAQLQVFEETRGLKIGDRVAFTGELLSAQLGPGLLGQVYDGLQNPLPDVAEKHGFFLPKGLAMPPLNEDKDWLFEPMVREGDSVSGGHYLGWVQEGIFQHRIMAPFSLTGQCKVTSIGEKGAYRVHDRVAEIEDEEGKRLPVALAFHWPVKMPIKAYRERLRPSEPLITGIRIIDTLFPIAKGGTYCIPGPFGAGKTVLQQITARYAEADIVIIAACGERAGEVVDTLREFPKIEDPRTGRSLMERTIIICNTSSMPVSSRESSVYTAVTIAEYYRQMGLHALLLADSTSRWAQAMREISGRLEEIPGDEAYPAYLESRIAGFYERAGLVRLHSEEIGSVTLGGTVSPAGGTFEEPVTQGTLKVVGAFHGLSRSRANARRFPSIDPHESWSKYTSFIPSEQLSVARSILAKGKDVGQMMKVVGEEGTTLEDYLDYLKSEVLDFAYLQQNAFDEVDGSTGKERQIYVFQRMVEILKASFSFEDKSEALSFFQSLRQTFINWNYKPWGSDEFKQTESNLLEMLDKVRKE